MRLSLSQSQTSEAESYQVVVATWKALDDVSGIGRMSVRMNDTDNRSYSISADGVYDNTTQVATAKFKFADYAPSNLNKLTMRDLALNPIQFILQVQKAMRSRRQLKLSQKRLTWSLQY